jgi:hypothetical protein
MNIFVTNPNPKVCAEALDDLRLNKMILETAQLLSTAIRFHGHIGDLAYKSTHVNHPCSMWARETVSNYAWLLGHFYALCQERFERTGKTHKSERLALTFEHSRHLLPSGSLTPFVNCTPYKDDGVFDAYKLTLVDKWKNDKRPPKWTNTTKPSWI